MKVPDTNPDVRWLQRFEHFDRAVANLRDAIDMDVTTMSSLEKEGTIQRFEVAVELAWKTVKDFLEGSGLTVEQTPKSVMKAAFATGIVVEGQVWIDILVLRNSLAHTYDEAILQQAVESISSRYMSAIADLHAWLTSRKTSHA